MKPAFQPPPTRPSESTMGGTRRMDDPSERRQDRLRRAGMNVVLVLIIAAAAAQVTITGLAGWRWLLAGLLVIGGTPLAMYPRVFELRFKMSREERRQAVAQLPAPAKTAWVIYAVLVTGLVLVSGDLVVWILPGAWARDFVTYYHDRPQRMRHLYAITATLDDLRSWRRPWTWTLPGWAWVAWSAFR